MGNISFTPDFVHTEWVDNVDRVRAGEPNGFNGRFSTIESDLHRLSNVVAQIDDALDALETTPAPKPVRLPVSPALLSMTGNHNWDATSSGAAQALLGRQPIGTVNVDVPDGVRLISLRAAGLADGINQLMIGFTRVPYDAPSAARDLAVFVADTTNFDKTVTVDPTVDRVDINAFRYIIVAICEQTPTDRLRAIISTVQITYIAD
jgi:hypothetical protein